MSHFLKALQAGHSHTSIILAITRSEEFLNRLPGNINKQVHRENAADILFTYEHKLNHDYIGLEKYEEIWKHTRKNNVDDYLTLHKTRYYELFNAMAYYLKNITLPKVLIIGPSIFLPFFTRLFPNIFLTTIDRPLKADGATEDFAISRGAHRHYNIDLNTENLFPNFGNPPIGRFDYVCCTEVLEHLMVNPVIFLEDLISLLKPNGTLYISTPNFFSYQNLANIKVEENPQQVFPGWEENKDNHYHFREYCMKELVRFTELAHGKIDCAYYSHCWDPPELVSTELKNHPNQKSNLVIIIKPQE